MEPPIRKKGVPKSIHPRLTVEQSDLVKERLLSVLLDCKAEKFINLNPTLSNVSGAFGKKRFVCLCCTGGFHV